MSAQAPDFEITPNPFAQNLQYSFHIYSSSQVSLSVFDMLGSNVAVLLSDTNLNVGYYEYTATLNYLKAGVYLFRLDIGDSTYLKRAVKTEPATFTCPLASNVNGDTLFLNFEIVNLNGDSVKYRLYDRWGVQVLALDTFLEAGVYSYVFPLDTIPDNGYVQSFEQGISNCRNYIIIDRTPVKIKEYSTKDNIQLLRLDEDRLMLKAQFDFKVHIVNALGQKMIDTSCNHAFFLKRGLYFFIVENNEGKAVVLKYFQE